MSDIDSPICWGVRGREGNRLTRGPRAIAPAAGAESVADADEADCDADHAVVRQKFGGTWSEMPALVGRPEWQQTVRRARRMGGLLHLLLLLKQTRNATDRGIVLDFGGPGHMVNLGSFEDAVYKHCSTTFRKARRC